MGTEIERKFLVSGDIPKGIMYRIVQGYIDNSLGDLRVFENCLVISDKNFYHKIDIGLDSKEILDNITHNEGVLTLSETETARIRIKNNACSKYDWSTNIGQSFITIKGKTTSQGTPEFEYPLPLFCAHYFLKKLTKVYIEKIRHLIKFEGKLWEVDVFINPSDLVIAEVELSRPDEEIVIPEWVGEEVTGNPEYFNSQIIKKIKI